MNIYDSYNISHILNFIRFEFYSGSALESWY